MNLGESKNEIRGISSQNVVNEDIMERTREKMKNLFRKIKEERKRA